MDFFIYIPQSLAVRTIKLPHSCYYFFPCFCPQKRQQSYLAAIHSSGTQTWPTGGTENTYTVWTEWRKNLLLSSGHVSHHKSSTYKWQQLLPSTQQAKLPSKKHAKETYSNVRGWVHWQRLEEGMHLCMWDNRAISSIRSQLKHRPFSERCHKPDTSPIFHFPALPPCPSRLTQAPCTAEQLFQNTGHLSSEALRYLWVWKSEPFGSLPVNGNDWKEGGVGLCAALHSLFIVKRGSLQLTGPWR